MPYKDPAKSAEVKRKYSASEAGSLCRERYNNSPKGQRTRHNGHLKRTYNITIEDYEKILAEQGGHCALCPTTPEQNYGHKLHVDHNKKTDDVRGLLCKSCNTALGKLGDDEEGLWKAIGYLRKSYV